jgi:hypothetical protein
MDDSGTHDTSQICVVAGYFAGERSWILFDRAWRKVLTSEGLVEFHANRFWAQVSGAQTSEYKSWTRTRLNCLMSSLLDVISSHRIYPVGCAVVMNEWAALPLDEKRYLTGAACQNGRLVTPGAPRKSYFLPFLCAIQTAASYCHAGDKMHSSFDQSSRFSSYALNYFKLMKQFPGQTASKLGEPFFPDSATAAPIQAADLLAYETNVYMKKRFGMGLAKLDPRGVLAKALTRIRSWEKDFKLFDKAGLDTLLAKYRQDKLDS